MPTLDPRIDAIAQAIHRLEQRLSALSTQHPHFDVALDASTPSNFYRSMDGEDVVQFGGVFVATYAKLPALGATVSLTLELPGGVRQQSHAMVSWTQEHLGDDTPAGFGARLVAPTPELSHTIGQFVRYREPLVRE
jgi:hypothetical protein